MITIVHRTEAGPNIRKAETVVDSFVKTRKVLEYIVQLSVC